MVIGYLIVVHIVLGTVGTWAHFSICLILCAGHSGHMGTFFDLSYILCWAQWAHGHIFYVLFYVLGTVGTWAHSLIRLTYCSGHSGHMGTFFDLSCLLCWARWAHGHIFIFHCLHNVLGTVGTWAHFFIVLHNVLGTVGTWAHLKIKL